jgi:hypothetical protein
MMLMWMRRKTRALEKVENLYRTATVQKKLSSTTIQIESRSLDSRNIRATFAQDSHKPHGVLAMRRTVKTSQRVRITIPAVRDRASSSPPDPYPLPDMSHFAVEL